MKRLTILVPAAQQANGNKAWKILDAGPTGDQTFTSGYSSDGNGAATYYAASGLFSNGDVAALATAASAWSALNSYATQRGRTVPFTQSQFNAVYSTIIISAPDQDPNAFIAANGLMPLAA